MVKDKLELLSMAEGYMIKKKQGYAQTYEVQHDTAEVGAIISGDMIQYYITGVYNNCADWEEIDMDALMKLKKFCEFLVKE